MAWYLEGIKADPEQINVAFRRQLAPRTTRRCLPKARSSKTSRMAFFRVMRLAYSGFSKTQNGSRVRLEPFSGPYCCALASKANGQRLLATNWRHGSGLLRRAFIKNHPSHFATKRIAIRLAKTAPTTQTGCLQLQHRGHEGCRGQGMATSAWRATPRAQRMPRTGARLGVSLARTKCGWSQATWKRLATSAAEQLP